MLNTFYSQKLKLNSALEEISGLEIVNDSIFVAINDSGNEPIVFYLNERGEIIHQLLLKNANNLDWEDLTIDENKTIYVADIGNNALKKSNFCVYSFSFDEGLLNDTIEANKITFSYPLEFGNQDCESIVFYKDQLLLFTKNTKDKLKDQHYVFSLNPILQNQVAEHVTSFNLWKTRKYQLDELTSVAAYKDTLYFLTYSKIYVQTLENINQKPLKKYSLGLLSQKEAISVNDNYIYIGNEKSTFLRKQKIKRIKRK
jgi:hypothetical protein